MTFVFQDSVQMPVQKNFIDDLNNFLELIEKVLPVENKAIELNNQIKKKEDNFSKDTSQMEQFIIDLDDSLKNLSAKYAIESIGKCTDKLKEISEGCIQKQKEQLKIELEDLTRRSRDEVARMSEEIRSELETFLWSGVYNTNQTILLTGTLEKLSGSIKVNVNGFSYAYDVSYSGAPFQIKKFIEEISIPVWSKGGLIHKEDRIKYLDISEFIIKRIYIGDDFQLDLENKKGTKKVNVRVPGDVKHASIMYIENEATDITSDEHLAPQVDHDKLGKVCQRIKEFIENKENIASRSLLSVEIDEKDAIANNEIFDCIKIVASQYGELIKEIFNHGFTKNEIVIKEIIEDGTRNEIFISVDEITQRLSALGGDGLELKDLLNL